MVSITSKLSKSNTAKSDDTTIQRLTTQAIQEGRLSRQDHLKLTSAILSQPRLSDEDRSQINQVFDNIRMGHIQLID